MASQTRSILHHAWTAARRALRSPRTIVAELLVIAAAGVVLASIPQLELPSDLPRLAAEHPLAAPVAHALALDRILHSPWFWVPLLAGAGSLAIVLAEQWPRLLRQLRSAPSPGSFSRAPWRAEFVRPARGGATELQRHRQAGHLASPLFHTGLMLVLVAGLLRALFGRDAVVDLVEGETLPPAAGAFGAQWGGPLSRPLALPVPLSVAGISREQHPSGALSALSADAVLGRGDAARPVRIAINVPLDVGGTLVYLTNRNGVAALVRLGTDPAAPPQALLLEEGEGTGSYATTSVLADGSELIVRASAGPGGALPAAAELRVLRRGGLAFVGTLAVGRAAALPGGGFVALDGLRRWARFTAARDLAAPFAFAGFAVAILGVVLMVALVPFETAVLVTAVPEGERVVVALRPHRLSPIFEDRFARLVRDEGGPASP